MSEIGGNREKLENRGKVVSAWIWNTSGKPAGRPGSNKGSSSGCEKHRFCMNNEKWLHEVKGEG
jgi:hypothetical protein